MSEPGLVIIGASWGGLSAIGAILRELPASFEWPVLVVQHRPEDADGALVELLDRSGPLPVREADDKSPLEAGCVKLAPAGYHVLVERDHLELSTEGRVRYSRPSIDLAFESGARSFGRSLVGVVLTGANDDGAAGLATVRRNGGIAIVQDPAEAEQAAMPEAAARRADPQAVLALEAIAPLLVQIAAGSAA